MERSKPSAIKFVLLSMLAVSIGGLAFAQDKKVDPPTKKPGKEQEKKPGKAVREGTMTLKAMGDIVKRLDGQAKSPRPGVWQFTIGKLPVFVITDKKANRMRIMVPIRRAKGLTLQELQRISQANFDTALDSRYAIAKNILWSVFLHPLSELYPRQFIKGIGQTANLALTYGKTYNSGLQSYGGGDSQGILRRQLIDELLKKGIPI